MNKKLIILCGLFSSLLVVLPQLCSGQLAVQQLRCENRADPIGLDIRAPRFSWQMAAGGQNQEQSAYEIKLSLDNKIIWSTGKIYSDEPLYIPYAGPALQSGRRYTWQVRIWDNTGQSHLPGARPLFSKPRCYLRTIGRLPGSNRATRKRRLTVQAPCFVRNSAPEKRFGRQRPISQRTGYMRLA